MNYNSANFLRRHQISLIELRDYQRELLEQVQNALSYPAAKPMMQLPTGGGKTRIAAALLAGWLSGGRKAVWLTHRSELSDQTCQVLTATGSVLQMPCFGMSATLPLPGMAELSY